MKKMVVYRDADYSTSWISDKFAEEICQICMSLKCEKKNAIQLKEFIVDKIESDTCHESIIIFSQDIVPNTLIEDYFGNTTFREYLDNGGTILWIGDVPLANISTPCKQLVNGVFEKALYFYQLGIIPINAVPKRPIDFTEEGKKIKLKHIWSGIRPIINSDFDLIILTESENIISIPFLNIPKQGIKLKGVEFAGFKLEVIKDVDMAKININSSFGETYPNAWIKNYNKNYPHTGFVRIWDYIPRNINQSMKDDFKNIIIKLGKDE